MGCSRTRRSSAGSSRRLDEHHLRTLTILGFPNLSRPGILDALNHQGFSYRWVTRFIALDKTEATKALTKLRRQWFNKRKSITALLREVMYNQPAQLLDSDADNKMRRRRPRASGAGRRSCRLRASDHDDHRVAMSTPPASRKSCGRSSGS